MKAVVDQFAETLAAIGVIDTIPRQAKVERPRRANFGQHLPDTEILMMPVAHDPLRAKTTRRARFKVANCAAPIRSSTDTLDSGVRKGCEEHNLGADASDDALIKAIGRRDRHAMALLYGRHHVRVYRFALRITGDASSAEDVVSEVFLQIWRQADRFESRAQVSTWLLAIARYKALSARRRRIDAKLDAEIASTIADPADDPEAALQKKKRSELLHKSLARLSPEDGEVIDLVYYHGKSVKQVADIVGVAEATVKTRMFYARKKLAELVAAS